MDVVAEESMLLPRVIWTMDIILCVVQTVP